MILDMIARANYYLLSCFENVNCLIVHTYIFFVTIIFTHIELFKSVRLKKNSKQIPANSEHAKDSAEIMSFYDS